MKLIQYLGDSPWGNVNPEALKTEGMGGRETALVKLSEEWAKRGHEVVNFVSAKEAHHSFYPEVEGVASYVDSGMAVRYLKEFPSDAIISWEEPRLFVSPDVRANTKRTIVEMQVAHLQVDLPEVNCDPFIDRYAVLSQWAGEFLTTFEPAISQEKIQVLPNGISLDRYKNPRVGHSGGSPYVFFYSSSPDRGLHHLLRIWPRIREMYPNSALHVAYGIESWTERTIWSHNFQSEVALDVVEGVRQEGVHYHGKIGQDRLAQLQLSADALLYTCDTMQPTETGCITAIEAMAAGAVPILTKCDCLPSEFGQTAVFAHLPFEDDTYLGALQMVMDDPDYYETLQRAGRTFAEGRDWGLIAERWIDEVIT